MDVLKKARRLVAKLTEEDRIKLRLCSIDECLSAAIMFEEAGKAKHFAKMKNTMENFVKTLRLLEKED
jgi:hypothetical protein